MKPSSSSSGRGLRGSRPHPLKVSKDSRKASKPPAAGFAAAVAGSRQSSATIFYLQSPKVIHARPQEFMSLVQSLTGKDSVDTERSTWGSVRAGRGDLDENWGAEGDPLVLTLGQSSYSPVWVSGPGSSWDEPVSRF